MGASIKFILSGLIIAILGGTALSSTGMDDNSSNIRMVDYELELIDPVRPESAERTCSVILSLDSHGFPKEYQFFLQTEVCLDRICKRLEVTLFWDALGQYSRLEYPERMPLTKNDHTEFLQMDYDRLDSILKDKGSILGIHPLSHIVIPPALVADDVDVVTSATRPTVQESVVSGAAYTSWVLWHWVNGEMADKLPILTLSYCTPDYLNHCLLSDDPRFLQFAFQHLLNNGLYDVQYLEACFQILEKSSSQANCQLALQYMGSLSQESEELNQRLVELIGVNAASSRLILHYFETLADATPALWARLAERLEQMPAYYDVHRSLNLLEHRAGRSESVRLAVERLLGNDNRFIARRAQEFLKTQPRESF